MKAGDTAGAEVSFLASVALNNTAQGLRALAVVRGGFGNLTGAAALYRRAWVLVRDAATIGTRSDDGSGANQRDGGGNRDDSGGGGSPAGSSVSGPTASGLARNIAAEYCEFLLVHATVKDSKRYVHTGSTNAAVAAAAAAASAAAAAAAAAAEETVSYVASSALLALVQEVEAMPVSTGVANVDRVKKCRIEVALTAGREEASGSGADKALALLRTDFPSLGAGQTLLIDQWYTAQYMLETRRTGMPLSLIDRLHVRRANPPPPGIDFRGAN